MESRVARFGLSTGVGFTPQKNLVRPAQGGVDIQENEPLNQEGAQPLLTPGMLYSILRLTTKLVDNPNGDSQEIKKFLKTFDNAKPADEAKDGEDAIGINPLTGDIVLNKKNMMGSYGTVLKQDGSVVQNRPPALGGPEELLPPGTFNFKAMERLYKVKNLPTPS